MFTVMIARFFRRFMLFFFMVFLLRRRFMLFAFMRVWTRFMMFVLVMTLLAFMYRFTACLFFVRIFLIRRRPSNFVLRFERMLLFR